MAWKGPPTRAPSASRGRGPQRGQAISAALILAVAFIATSLYFVLVHVPTERAQAVGAWETRLRAMADDRKEAIAAWVAGGKADALTVAGFPTVAPVLRETAGRSPRAAADVVHLRRVLEGFVEAHGHLAVHVVDAHGRAVATGGGGSGNDACLALAARLGAPGAPFAEFCARDGGMPVVLFGAPIFGEPTVMAGRPSPVLGTAVVLADPAAWLYPLVTREPTPTATGEVLLVRREGNRIAFLSPLRHMRARPMGFTTPIGNVPLAARAAVEGIDGFGSFVDYRGVPVFAVAGRVKGTAWGIVAKVDRREALSVYRANLARSGLVAAGLALAVAGIGFGVWRARRANYEAALARSHARESLLLDQANDAILFVATDGRILDANQKAETLYGYGRDELLWCSVGDLWAEEARSSVTEEMANASGPAGHVFRSVHRRKDGTAFPVEISTRLAETDRGKAFLAIVRDLSERVATERRIESLNRLLQAVTEIDQLLVRERDRSSLLEETCRIAVEHGRFRMAWVGLADLVSGLVKPVAVAGFHTGYLQEVEIRFDDTPQGHGPTGTAIRENRAVVVNDWASDGTITVWRGAGGRRGYRSSAAFPISVEGRAKGALSVYSDTAGVFVPEVVNLLRDLTDNLGFALQVMEGEERRRLAEEALQREHTKTQQYLDVAGVMLLVLDVQGRIELINRKGCEVLGYKEEELLRRDWFDTCVPANVREETRSVFRRVVEGGPEPAEYHENPLVTKAGDERLFAFHNALIRDTQGRIGGVLSSGEDVTDRRRGETALRESEERYRQLIDSVQDVVFTLSPDGKITSLNPAFEKITGWRRDEWLGRPFAGLVHPDDLPTILRLFDRFLSGAASGLFEVRVRTNDGGWRTGEFNGVQLAVHGEVVGVLGTGRDITERKREGEERRKLAAAVEQSAEAILITDPEGTIEYVNPAFERITGYAASEAVGKNPRILKSGRHADTFYAEIWATLKRDQPWSGRLVNRRRDGKPIEVDATISPVRDPVGRIEHFVAVQRDVTLEAEMENRLRQAQRIEAVGKLAGGVAHDFNNLLQAMLSQTQIVGARADDPELVAGTVTELEQHIRRGAALSRQLLLFSRRETAKPESLDLNEVIGDALQLLRRLVRENIAFVVELANELLPVVADRGQLDQVLMNLVLNAADAMPGGGRLGIRSGADGEATVWLSVEDTGHGVPKEIRDRIFEPFFTTKSNEEGSGLGLSVVHGIVTQHRGSVVLEDRAGGGSIFRVVLPRNRSGGAAPRPAERAAAQGTPRGSGERIIVVEDEAGAREGLVDLLSMLGYEVTAAGSAREVELLASEGGFDLLLSDLLLPDVSGADLAARLRERWPRLRVILMSGYTEDEAVRRDVVAGTVRFLQKPFDMKTLAREIRAALTPT